MTRLRERLLAQAGHAREAPLVVVAPYRICPIGAHVDHQGGPVLGSAIDSETLVAFLPSGSDHCQLTSTNFPEAFEMQLGSDEHSPDGWARYFWAAAGCVQERLDGRAPRGILALVEGSLPGGGLSSSASVVLAYLCALARVNEIDLTPQDLVALSRHAENEYVGVKCGILDPACIVGSRRDHLLSIDTQSCTWKAVGGERSARDSRFLVAFSGVDRNLRHTGFNDRVDQCHAAARRLGSLAGAPAEELGDLDDEVFEAHLESLPAIEQKRARHFLGERRRVVAGVAAWQAGDLESFGRLMSESCASSVENFEVGSPEIVALHRLVVETPGVYGARFSGAGFGGCVVALVDASRAEECRERIERAYRTSAPDLTEARVFLARSRNGLHVR